uniref:Acetyltransferase n=2 Tax=Oryza brachyantha TaxID=4533 RepID=J3MPS0_ORYBR
MAPTQVEVEGGGVRVVSRRLVRPEPCAPPEQAAETMHLTPWDLRMMAVECIQKGVLLPRPPAGGQHHVEHLASSFARALARFYPLAGRLAVEEIDDDDGGGGASRELRSISISLCCNDKGAEFVHAVAPGVTVADITASVYVPRVVWSFFPLNGMVGAAAAVDCRPVLAAQVTELADGVFVAMSLSHGVADGGTFWHLFRTWSEMSRGCELSTPSPVLERWFVDSCPVPIPLPFATPEDMIRQAEYPPVQECFFHFTAESVKKLKAKANDEMAGEATATISSLQSLLAHLWRAVCRARRLSPEQETRYALPVGCRARVKGLAQGYLGNAVAPVAAKAAAGEVMDKGLGWTAWLLNRAVASVDEASVRGTLAAWPEKPSFLRMADLQKQAGGGMGTSNSPRFDVYGNDFGWGRPVGVRSGGGNKLDGKMTVYEGRDGGGSMALEVCLAPEALARLVADEEFMGAPA